MSALMDDGRWIAFVVFSWPIMTYPVDTIQVLVVATYWYDSTMHSTVYV